ncbi:MAG: hypothetical protein K2H85_06570, partial [Allobaculum sp.]|nr:hypothetical protein [Allobaculum sp.]
MNKKKLFGALASAAMLINGAPLNVFAEEMVETGPSGALPGADATNVGLNSTNFPDDNLLTAIKNQNPTASTAADVKTLDVSGNAVTSLSGLQYLTNLEEFSLRGNDNLSTLDLSSNTKLMSLNVVSNGALTSITLPNDEDLKNLSIIGNAGLDDIDLAPAALLENVQLYGNSLDTLNLSKNVYITYLDVSGNDLYQLDATPCKQLETLNVSNNKIYELKVPTAIPNALKNLYAQSNKLQEFDGSALKGLTELNLSLNMLKSVNLPQNTFTLLNLSYNHLASLDLKKVTLQIANDTTEEETAWQNIVINPQYLYANSTDKAVNIKDYDANFNPDNATLPNGDEFNSNGVFNIPEVPGEASKAEFRDDNTSITVNVDKDGNVTGVTVYLNGVPVNAANYTLDPDLTKMTLAEIQAYAGNVTVRGQNHYRGVATIAAEDININSGGEPTTSVVLNKENTKVVLSKKVADEPSDDTSDEASSDEASSDEASSDEASS